MKPAQPQQVEQVAIPPLIASLQTRLAGDLPGPAAMRGWSPQLAYGRHFVPPPSDARRAAVAVLLYPRDNEWHLALTLRPAHLSTHAGQVSLPGGSLDAGETVEQGALRELEEELGVPRTSPQPLGRLTPLYIFSSHFYVTPCVSWLAREVEFCPCADEVAAVIEWPLAVLTTPHSQQEMLIERRELRFQARCWQRDSVQVWGASALILAELAALVAGAESLEGLAGSRCA
jgi:8-oxo-dGTP pyrophosphatase MutT (NUDIX family)